MPENILLENSLPLICEGLPLYGDFRNMIRFETALYDDAISNSEKAYIGLLQLFDNVPTSETELLKHTQILIWFYSIELAGNTKFEKTGNNTFMSINANYAQQKSIKNENTQLPDASKNIRAYDFETDSFCIYASFLQAYNIDLTKSDFFHWWKFCALLENLPAHTPMAQRMAYRTMDTSLIKDKAQREYYERLKQNFKIKQIAKHNKIKTIEDIANYNKERIKQRFEYAKNAVANNNDIK